MLNNITMNHSANNSAACWCCINYDCVYFFNSQRSTHLITHHFLYVIVSVHTRKILSDFLSFSMHCTTCFISVCVCVCVCVYVCVCVWNTVCHLCRGSRIICHVKTASFLIYLPKVNGVTTSDIYFTLNMKYVFLIFFIDKVFAQYCTKGHCEKINDCLFWQAFLWLFSVLYGNAFFFFFLPMDIQAIEINCCFMQGYE